MVGDDLSLAAGMCGSVSGGPDNRWAAKSVDLLWLEVSPDAE